MNSVMRSLGLAAVIAFAASPALSKTYDLHDISGNSDFLGVFKVVGSGPTNAFLDKITFNLTKSFDLSAVVATTVKGIQGLSLSLYTAGGKDLIDGTPGAFGPGFKYSLEPGSYFFQVSGFGSGSYVGSASFDVSPVPLPASLPMFGAAILALAGFGLVRRAKTPYGFLNLMQD